MSDSADYPASINNLELLQMRTKQSVGLHGNLQWKHCKTMGRLYKHWEVSACGAGDIGALSLHFGPFSTGQLE